MSEITFENISDISQIEECLSNAEHPDHKEQCCVKTIPVQPAGIDCVETPDGEGCSEYATAAKTVLTDPLFVKYCQPIFEGN